MSGEDVETNQNANGCTPSSVDASKSSNTSLQYYSSFRKVDKFLTELGEDPNFTFSEDEKKEKKKLWKRYYLHTGQISRKDITDAEVVKSGLDTMLKLVSDMRTDLVNDVTIIEGCFEELRTKIRTDTQLSAG